MMKQIHIFNAYFVKIILPFYFHRLCLYPLAILPIASVCRNLTNIYLRIEVGCKRIPMVAAIAVEYIDIIYFIEYMLLSIRTEHTGHPRVKTAAQNGCYSSFLKLFTVSPLPFIFKLGSIGRFIVCSIQIIHFSFKTCVHYSQILIRQRDVYYYLRLI